LTGGASGFGAATAQLFASEGAKVLIADLNESDGTRIAATNPKQMIFQKANVATQQSWRELVQTVEQQFGKLDIVVNNAGTSYANKPTLEVTEEEFDLTNDVNVKSIFWSVKACVPAMQRSGKGGCFVNVASIGAMRPRPGLVWYAASKASVANVSHSWGGVLTANR
jgi:NAD(P)-dependent dehydrogenase (short-subunit alcohol dehydrogenase family)